MCALVTKNHDYNMIRRYDIDPETLTMRQNLIYLIQTIWLSLKDNPSEIAFFYDDGIVGREPNILIIDTLIPLIKVPNNSIAAFARDTIIVICSIPNLILNEYLRKHTMLVQTIVGCVCRGIVLDFGFKFKKINNICIIFILLIFIRIYSSFKISVEVYI